jgi:uncharacterized protein (UPF0333 family)
MCKNICLDVKRMIEDKSPLLVIGIIILFIISVVIFTGMLLGVLNNNLTLVPLSVLGVSALFMLISLSIIIAMLYFACCSSKKPAVPAVVVVTPGAAAPVISPVSAATGDMTFTELSPLRISSKATTVRTADKKEVVSNLSKGGDGFVGTNPLRTTR